MCRFTPQWMLKSFKSQWLQFQKHDNIQNQFLVCTVEFKSYFHGEQSVLPFRIMYVEFLHEV